MLSITLVSAGTGKKKEKNEMKMHVSGLTQRGPAPGTMLPAITNPDRTLLARRAVTN